ncbi:MAG: B12-binding domain-containing radical SAM protein [Myxococcales bacterium]
MRALLVHPPTPPTYWGFQHSLPIAGKAASLPPLGLLSLAALLPSDWEIRVVDENVEPLTDDALRWADAVLVTGMLIHAAGIRRVLARARALGKRTVVGGPAVNTDPGAFPEARHVFRGEAEGRLLGLVRALAANDDEAPQLLSPEGDDRPSMEIVPAPRFELVDHRRYASMSVQYSRGCPFQCEFCDIIEVFGRKPRSKTPAQVLAELDRLRATGYRGSVFFVDDNFIGNRVAVAQLLPHVREWQEKNDFPFEFYTEASVDLATKPELVDSMVASGFSSVFLGIETPSAASLKETHKLQNLRQPSDDAVRLITAAGLEVYAGFIVGFDSDGPEIFEAQRSFISSLPVPVAMIGILTALPGTQLTRRLHKEGRLRIVSAGDQFDRPNFEPAMDERTLLSGYGELLANLYAPKAYYDRCVRLVTTVGKPKVHTRLRPGAMRVLARSIWTLGVLSPRRREFWRLFGTALLRAPHAAARAIELAIQGEHLIRYTQENVLPRLEQALKSMPRESAPKAKAKLDRPVAAEA